MFDSVATPRAQRLIELADSLNRDLDELYARHAGQPVGFIHAVLACHPTLCRLPQSFLELVADSVSDYRRVEFTPPRPV